MPCKTWSFPSQSLEGRRNFRRQNTLFKLEVNKGTVVNRVDHSQVSAWLEPQEEKPRLAPGCKQLLLNSKLDN